MVMPQQFIKGRGAYDLSYSLLSKYNNRHSTYVALTRHRDGAEVFWSKDEFPSYDQMIKSLSRESLKDVSLDYPNALNEYEKASFASRRGFDGLWETFLEKYAHPLIEKIKGVAISAFDEAKAYIEQLKNLYPGHVKKLEGLNAKFDDLSSGFIDTSADPATERSKSSLDETENVKNIIQSKQQWQATILSAKEQVLSNKIQENNEDTLVSRNQQFPEDWKKCP